MLLVGQIKNVFGHSTADAVKKDQAKNPLTTVATAAISKSSTSKLALPHRAPPPRPDQQVKPKVAEPKSEEKKDSKPPIQKGAVEVKKLPAPKREAPLLSQRYQLRNKFDPREMFYSEKQRIDSTRVGISNAKLMIILRPFPIEELMAILGFIFNDPGLKVYKERQIQSIASKPDSVDLIIQDKIIPAFSQASINAYDLQETTKIYYDKMLDNELIWRTVLQTNSQIIGCVIKALLIKADTKGREYNTGLLDELIPEYKKFLSKYRVILIVNQHKV